MAFYVIRCVRRSDAETMSKPHDVFVASNANDAVAPMQPCFVNAVYCQGDAHQANQALPTNAEKAKAKPRDSSQRANVASVLCLPRTIAHRHCEPSSKGVSGCARRVHIPLRAPRAVIIAAQLSASVPPITNLAAIFVMGPALVRAATAILRMNVLTKTWWDYLLGH